MSTNWSSDVLSLEIKQFAAWIEIARPEKLNALNRHLLEEFLRIQNFLQPLIEEGQVRSIFLIGSGEKAFVAGADIAEMSGLSVEEALVFGRLGHHVMNGMETLPCPVVALVHGFALGGGFELALSCDFIVATAQSVFSLPETGLGLIPGFGGTQRLSRLTNSYLAREMIFTAKKIKATQALELGLVSHLANTKEELIAYAQGLQESFAKTSPMALRLAKKVILEGTGRPLPQGLEGELQTFSAIFASEDKREGCQAFMEKRAPIFKGR